MDGTGRATSPCVDAGFAGSARSAAEPVAAAAPLEAQLTDVTTPPPLDLIETEHQKWLIVCDAMERVADQLPSTAIEPRVLGTAFLCTREAVARHHAAEQEGLFPLLRAHLDPAEPLHAMLECLEEDHEDLEDASDEAADILADLMEGGLKVSPDAAGYGLRCFFAFMRRHVRCELKIVVPAARTLLLGADVTALSATLASQKRHDKVVPIDWFRRYASAI